MKKIIVALAMLVGAMSAQAHSDQLDTLLKNRDTMVAAVAILTSMPPNCTVDNKNPSPEMIALFIIHYGHNGDNAFLADVNAQQTKLDGIMKFPEPDRSKMLEVTCAYSILLTTKVRDLARSNGKLY